MSAKFDFFLSYPCCFIITPENVPLSIPVSDDLNCMVFFTDVDLAQAFIEFGYKGEIPDGTYLLRFNNVGELLQTLNDNVETWREKIGNDVLGIVIDPSPPKPNCKIMATHDFVGALINEIEPDDFEPGLN